jgi:hypothetical protein
MHLAAIIAIMAMGTVMQCNVFHIDRVGLLTVL